MEPRKFLHKIDEGICAAIVGIPSDCVYTVKNIIRKEAFQHRLKFNSMISGDKIFSSQLKFLYQLSQREKTYQFGS